MTSRERNAASKKLRAIAHELKKLDITVERVQEMYEEYDGEKWRIYFLFMDALEEDHRPEIMAMLVKYIPKRYIRDDVLFHPHCAESLQILIDAGADVNAVDDNRNNETAIFYAEDADCIDVLVKAGAHVNAQDRYDDTAMRFHYAEYRVECCVRLFKYGGIGPMHIMKIAEGYLEDN